MMSLQVIAVLLWLGSAQAINEFEYATSCLPPARPSYSTTCTISIISASEANIEIQTYEGSSYETLSPGEVFQREFGTDFHPTPGVESKAIRVTSDVAVQVLVYKYDSYANYEDAYMVPDQYITGNTYLTTAYEGYGVDRCTSPTPYRQFFLVTSFYNETTISVSQHNGTTYEYQLPPFGTFLQTTNATNDFLASGTHISSSKPVNVVAGNLCVHLTSTTTLASSITPLDSLGEEYVVPKIISDSISYGGYHVSIVATEDSTVVVSDLDTVTLEQGETAMFSYDELDRSILVTCTKNCLVAQYTISISGQVGSFMQQILPESQFSTSAYFTTLDVHPTSYLSLVITGEEPGDDLYLNGDSLGSLNWTTINGYASAELPISSGEYELESRNGRLFAAYVYQHLEYQHGGSGYALLPMESPAPTPAPSSPAPSTPAPSTPAPSTPAPSTPAPSTPAPSTPALSTPSPSVNNTFPQHTARVNGTAYTEDGEDISPTCALAHLNNLDAKTRDMMAEVNEAIGESICLGAADMNVKSGRAAMFNQGNQALMVIDHTLEVQAQHVVDDVEGCAAEVAEYLNDHSHWQQPIFPEEPDCSRLLVNPPYFNTSGTFWNCDNQQIKDPENYADNYLSYESKVSEVLATLDGSNLDPGCTLAYADESSEKTIAMMTEISRALADSGCSDIVTSLSHMESLTALEDKAYFLASFYYVPARAAIFGEFVTCMQLVHEFSLEHENWSPGSQPGEPFLPVPPGCPAMEHEGTTLDDEGHRWECI